MSDARHHRAGRDRVQVIFVEVPAAGSPKQKHPRPPPGRYPTNQPEHWRPRTRPPTKSETSVQFLDNIRENDQAAHDHMANARRISMELRHPREQAGV